MHCNKSIQDGGRNELEHVCSNMIMACIKSAIHIVNDILVIYEVGFIQLIRVWNRASVSVNISGPRPNALILSN